MLAAFVMVGALSSCDKADTNPDIVGLWKVEAITTYGPDATTSDKITNGFPLWETLVKNVEHEGRLQAFLAISADGKWVENRLQIGYRYYDNGDITHSELTKVVEFNFNEVSSVWHWEEDGTIFFSGNSWIMDSRVYVGADDQYLIGHPKYQVRMDGPDKLVFKSTSREIVFARCSPTEYETVVAHMREKDADFFKAKPSN